MYSGLGAKLKRYLLLTMLLLVSASTALAADATGTRPALWAQPVATQELKNFYRLDDKVYRSAQPDEEGFAELQQLGITTILNLRDYHSDDDEAEGLDLTLRRVEMDAGSITVEQLVAALREIHQAKGPVLIHCWHGSDRTGTVSAGYRIIMQGWSREAAVDELVNGGYGYHAIYGNIPELLKGLDIEAVRAAVFAP